MKLSRIVRDITTRLRCARRHRTMIASLEALNERQLEDIGLWRGAIPVAAAKTLSAQGCPGFAGRSAPRHDLETTPDRAA